VANNISRRGFEPESAQTLALRRNGHGFGPPAGGLGIDLIGASKSPQERHLMPVSHRAARPIVFPA
jgi:hypothetical protein